MGKSTDRMQESCCWYKPHGLCLLYICFIIVCYSQGLRIKTPSTNLAFNFLTHTRTLSSNVNTYQSIILHDLCSTFWMREALNKHFVCFRRFERSVTVIVSITRPEKDSTHRLLIQVQLLKISQYSGMTYTHSKRDLKLYSYFQYNSWKLPHYINGSHFLYGFFFC